MKRRKAKSKRELNYEKGGESSFRSYWKSLELICTVSTHRTTECSMFRKDGCQLCQSYTRLEKCVCPKEVGIFNLTKGKHKWVWIKLRLKRTVQSVQSFIQSCLTLCNPMDCMQHARLPCPSPTPRAYSNPCPSRQWCHPAISSSGVPFSFCLQSFPASGSFPVSRFFMSGGQSIGVSASASVFPKNTQDWFLLKMDWLDLLAV